MRHQNGGIHLADERHAHAAQRPFIGSLVGSSKTSSAVILYWNIRTPKTLNVWDGSIRMMIIDQAGQDSGNVTQL